MQACYVNTTHPDFLNGHKAMAIVAQRMEAAKPPEKPIDPKSGKLPPGALNNGRDLDADPRRNDEGSFFGSFFAKDKVPKRAGTPVMQAPPAVIRPLAASNEREIMETEVIKLLITSYFSVVKREMIDMVPKAITLTLVNFAKENLQRVLLENLYSESSDSDHNCSPLNCLQPSLQNLRSWTNFSRRRRMLFPDGRNASRWLEL